MYPSLGGSLKCQTYITFRWSVMASYPAADALSARRRSRGCSASELCRRERTRVLGPGLNCPEIF